MIRRWIFRSAWIALALVAAASAGPGGAAAAVPPPSTSSATALWAWVVVRNPTASVLLSPGKDSGNSVGCSNAVDHLGTGQYVLSLCGVEAPTGNVLVSAL